MAASGNLVSFPGIATRTSKPVPARGRRRINFQTGQALDLLAREGRLCFVAMMRGSTSLAVCCAPIRMMPSERPRHSMRLAARVSPAAARSARRRSTVPRIWRPARGDAAVPVCDSRAADLGAAAREAGSVVVAAGHPVLISGDMLRPGAVVVDVGINVVDGRLLGDVDFASASGVVSAITPVPGGVGPVTSALLMTHVLRAARAQADAERRTRPAVSGRHG